MFSARASWDLTPSALAQRVAAARAAKRALFDLTNANPASLALPGELLSEALAEAARAPETLRYEPDPRGDVRARAAIAAYHNAQGAKLEPEHIVLTAGTSEGYAQLFRVLADPGELVHLPTPGYPLFEHLAELEGLACARYRLLPPECGSPHWPLDLDGLASSLMPESRALIAIHPHNPTGAFVSTRDLASLRSVCRERELALLSDEVFADSAPGPVRPSLLAGAEDGPLCCVLSGASKVLGVPQLKLAWIAVGGPPALRDEALARLEFAADAYLSVSPLAARALAALFARRAEIRAELVERVAAKRAALGAAHAPVRGAR
ncbi:MAG: pyridoxal phosphate-dependent aminotransferase, partial [Myxococcota bacterium]